MLNSRFDLPEAIFTSPTARLRYHFVSFTTEIAAFDPRFWFHAMMMGCALKLRVKGRRLLLPPGRRLPARRDPCL